MFLAYNGVIDRQVDDLGLCTHQPNVRRQQGGQGTGSAEEIPGIMAQMTDQLQPSA